MILAFLFFPVLIGLLCLLIKSHWLRPLVITGAVIHFGLTIASFFYQFVCVTGWLGVDAPTKLFLLVLSVLFLLVSIYSRDYMTLNSKVLEHESKYSCCLLCMLGTMSIVIMSRHFGITWLAMGCTVLLSIPLVYYHHTRAALEAMWKYLMICAVGLGLALMGNMLLVYAYQGVETPLMLDNLLNLEFHGEVKWLKASYIFFLVGYGTIMGLAPMHSWLPDSYSEAPSPVSALFPALMNCAFLVILRFGQVCNVAGLGSFRQELLIFFGVASLLFAAVFVIGQKDYPRMLAYTSVAHAGLMVLGAGAGAIGMVGAMIHIFVHSLIKGMLFMLSGNIIAVYRSRHIDKVGGMLQIIPSSGVMWLAGFMALSGLPPFGIYQSNLRICKGLVESGSYIVLGISLLLMGIIFVGMLCVFVPMAIDTPPSGISLKPGDPILKKLLVPSTLAALLALTLGLYIPPWLEQLLSESARIFGG